MLRAFLAISAAAWTVAAGAETYKWVDERGVVNYSNNPPPVAMAGKQLARVEDRISTYESDPALARAAAARAAMPRPDYAEIEWLQRQRLMAQAQQAYAGADCDYRADCRPAYLSSGFYPFIPAGFARRPAIVRPTFFVSQPAFARSRGSTMFR